MTDKRCNLCDRVITTPFRRCADCTRAFDHAKRVIVVSLLALGLMHGVVYLGWLP